MTSHGVVARLRKTLGTRKIGHAGTLDPMATGLLLAGVGRATRLLGHLQLADKSYDATVRLGYATSTDDAEGEALGPADPTGLTEARVRAAFAACTGVIQQKPSAVSAIKVDGQRAYARVRAGEEVDLPAREVTIHELAISEIRAGESWWEVDISVTCTTGTYIRAIARDVGADLGVGGHLTALRRTSVGPFDLSDASDLPGGSDLGGGDLPAPTLLPIEDVARRCFEAVDLTEEQASDVRYGRSLELTLGDGPTALFAPDGEFLALYSQEGERARPVAVFVTP